MGSLRLILRSLVYHRRAHAGLFIGTALAAAILVGALAVGDSVEYTLRRHALLRLGTVSLAVTSGDRLFSEDLADATEARLNAPVSEALALLGMAIRQEAAGGGRAQVNRVQVLGVPDGFWAFGDSLPGPLGRREAVVNERLAGALGVAPGDSIALRIAAPSLLSRDVPLSSREEESSRRANFTVRAVATDDQMGRFSLQAGQIPPHNCFVRLADLQQLAETPGRVNLLLIGQGATSDETQSALDEVWRPEHAGLKVADRGNGLLQLESDRIFFDEPTERAALALPGAQGALTYLVNAIHNDRFSTPYSFMTAGGSLTDDLDEDEIVINSWLAEQLDTRQGDPLTVRYYEVLPSNRYVERSRMFLVKRVLPIEALAQEKELVPEFPGLSNVESCKDWKIGMPMDEEMLKDKPNEAYWRRYRQTPKALVSLAAGQSMWGNRFGRLTAVRFPGATRPEDILDGLARRLGPADVGLEVRPVREEAEAAASQATDLGGLFLGMSLFLLASALILTGMLYAFGMQQRAEELGTFSALGFPRGRIFLLMLGEALVVAVLGAATGVVAGLGYAGLLMAGVSRLWPEAVGHIAIHFRPTFASTAVGASATVLCAAMAVSFTLRRLLRYNASALMNADFTQEYRPRVAKARSLVLAIAALAAAIALTAYALIRPPAEVAMPFFASGALLLIAGLSLAGYLLSRASSRREPRPPTMLRVGMLNATRRRGRSLGIVSSLAAGGFLILAVSSMQSEPAARAEDRDSGTGGFAYYGEATVPIVDPVEMAKAAPDADILPIRLYEGDDASCLNLNRAQTPRVLGVDEGELARLGAFDADVWDLLNRDLGEGVVPALVGDADTAMWTLKRKTGLEDGDALVYKDEAGRDVSLKLVGNLPMRLSVFQGTILISADHFTRLWPSREGFQVFLIDAPPESRGPGVAALAKAFDRHGLELTPTVERLAMFHAVEGTYLNMFLVLGGIGLLLGASATGVVALRNLLERRREVALLRAVGFTSDALFRLFALEYGVMLAMGAVVGGAASLVAMLPALASSHSESSPLWRFAVFVLVLAAAVACSWAALAVALRRTDTAALRTE